MLFSSWLSDCLHSLTGGDQSSGLKLESYRFNLHDNPCGLGVREREKKVGGEGGG